MQSKLIILACALIALVAYVCPWMAYYASKDKSKEPPNLFTVQVNSPEGGGAAVNIKTQPMPDQEMVDHAVEKALEKMFGHGGQEDEH